MNQSRFSPKLLAGIILALLFGVALYLRTALPYDQVFVGDWIKFTGPDAYYHMRIVDNLVQNFPHRITFDPYIHYPYGGTWSSAPFFDWLLAGIILLVGLGSPTQQTVDIVGVYFPAVLGALTVIPVYFIGKEVFNRWVGIISAGLVAILPGEFLGRSILGFTDHHVAEVLFTTITMLFLILAVKTARERQWSFSHIMHRDWAVITKPLIYSLLAGIFLGIYLITWQGGPLFVFIIFTYFVIQFIINHLRSELTDYLCLISATSFLVALIMVVSIFQGQLYVASLVTASITPVILSIVSRLMASKQVKPVYYPLTLVGLALAGIAIFYVIAPTLLGSIFSRFSIFTPGTIGMTILEVHPLLFPYGDFSLSVAWGNFTTSFFLSFISLGMLIYLIIKRGEADKTLIVVWSLVILAATLGHRRFAYYFVVNVALLTGYISWQILEFAGIKKLVAKPAETFKTVKRKKGKLKKPRRATGLTTSHVRAALGITAVFFLVYFPNISAAINTASQAPFTPDNAWYRSLLWLQENSPEPFGDPDFYYERYEPPPPGKRYQYPESAYGVMARWEYGHWITRIAHRLPNHGPGGGWSSKVGRFFTAQDEASANEIIEQLDSRYVIIGYDTTTTKFYAGAIWAGSSPEEFLDIFYLPQDDKLVPGYLFYPEYYRSLAVRLYNFDGTSVTPKSSTVISYQKRINREGELYKEITSLQSFTSYEEAEAYVAGKESSNYIIAGTDPFISPVPLKALEHYKLIYSSDSYIMQPGVGIIPSVKIFEYVK